MDHNLINLSIWVYISTSLLGIGLCFYINSFIQTNVYTKKNKIIAALALIVHIIIGSELLRPAISEYGLFGYTLKYNSYNEYIAYTVVFIILSSIKSIDEGNWKTRLKHILGAIPLFFILSLGILIMILIFDYARGVDNELFNALFPYKSVMEDLPVNKGKE
ncbi:MAG: hypothetical protein FE834_04375 [Gammaproteobacteria bacterium]|nr:hypothetical protein [Gammaproteobacteria bacterium]